MKEADAPLIFDTEEERSAADAALTLIQKKYERRLTNGIGGLSDSAVQDEIIMDVQQVMRPKQETLDGVVLPYRAMEIRPVPSVNHRIARRRFDRDLIHIKASLFHSAMLNFWIIRETQK